MKTQFASPRNMGKPGELEALYRIFPWIKELAGDRDVSVIYIMSPDELPDHHFQISANGYNTTGRIILRKGEEIVRDITWDNVHMHRRELGLGDTHLNSPQTEMVGDEDVCVILQDHAHDHDTDFRGISMEIFMCQKGIIFDEFSTFQVWLAEIHVRQLLKQIGVLA